jgi:hypothetical protein
MGQWTWAIKDFLNPDKCSSQGFDEGVSKSGIIWANGLYRFGAFPRSDYQSVGVDEGVSNSGIIWANGLYRFGAFPRSDYQSVGVDEGVSRRPRPEILWWSRTFPISDQHGL